MVVQSIIRSYREAGQLAVAKVRELSIDIATDDAAARRDMLVKCAMTSMNSKLVRITGHSLTSSPPERWSSSQQQMRTPLQAPIAS